jgi:hypothetical protein
MKMTWLHKFFGLFFIPVDGQAKSAQQLISTVLPFHTQYFPCFYTFDSFLAGLGRNQVYNANCSAQLTHNQFKPVQQSRQQVQRAY